MFGWLKKQRLREQHKLLYQNSMATHVFCELFMEQGRRAKSEGNHKQSAEYFEEADMLNALSEQVRSIASVLNHGELASSEQTKALLEINRIMRRVYDESASKYVRSFDQDYTPVGGWKFYYTMQEGKYMDCQEP